MAEPITGRTRSYPFTAFNFAVEIKVPGVAEEVCGAAFAECDGMEITMDVKTIREGGNNDRQIRLAGPLGFGQLTLKRGMTSSLDLWNWMKSAVADPSLRADAEIVLFDADGQTKLASFILARCIPVKLKGPSLNAKDGMIAIEELQLAYESLRVQGI